MLGSEEAKELIELGRKVVLSSLESAKLEVPESLKLKFSEKMSVFTTLLTYPEEELRGCIGVPEPLLPLWKAVIESSLGASFKDPRFSPLKKEELSKVLWEISFLQGFERIDMELLEKLVRVGRHGLMVVCRCRKGLLLPQVAVKYGWSVKEFLENTCRKAGLSKECWKDTSCKVYIFESSVFKEVKPWGEVIRLS